MKLLNSQCVWRNYLDYNFLTWLLLMIKQNNTITQIYIINQQTLVYIHYMIAMYQLNKN